MDALIAKADAAGPSNPKKPQRPRPSRSSHPTSHSDPTLNSVVGRTRVPSSLAFPAEELAPPPASDAKVSSRFLKSKLSRQHSERQHAALARRDVELLLPDVAGGLEVEGELERTWKVGQDEVVREVGLEAATARREIKLDGGEYALRWARNGRHLAIAGKRGHVSTFDWQTGNVYSELQLRETVRDVTFLHDYTMTAVAQKKHVFIYDINGVELHRLASHIEVNRLEFLPYHFLLVTIGNAGYLKYQDTSTGQLLTEHRTKLGACATMCQNPHNAVIHLGHQNGTVTLWVPNLSQPAVRLQAHLGPITGLAVDAKSEGRYLASTGLDGKVKVWDCRNWGKCVREWVPREGGAGGHVEWSGRGLLGLARGRRVNVYASPSLLGPSKPQRPPALYMTHHLPSAASSIRFQPFEDLLAVGHETGFSTLLVPGAGEPNPDSVEADIYESRKGRREREVRSLLDKIQPEMISLDSSFIGSIAPVPKAPFSAAPAPFARLPRTERLRVQGKSDEPADQEGMDEDEDEAEGADPAVREEKEKMKQRGRGKSMKRFLRKKRKNVIDPTTVAVKQKMAAIREQQARRERVEAGGDGEETGRKSALSRFRKK